MDPNRPYSEQVRLLVELLPLIARRTEFALKGGTAINLFIRDMPRLSVGIDLTYLPVQDRNKSLTAIDQALVDLATEIVSTRAAAVRTPGQGSFRIHGNSIATL